MDVEYDLPGTWVDVTGGAHIDAVLGAFAGAPDRMLAQTSEALREFTSSQQDEGSRVFVAVSPLLPIFGSLLVATQPTSEARSWTDELTEQVKRVAQAIVESGTDFAAASAVTDEVGVVRAFRSNRLDPTKQVIVSYLVLNSWSEDLLSLAFTCPRLAGPAALPFFDGVAVSARWASPSKNDPAKDLKRSADTASSGSSARIARNRPPRIADAANPA